MSKYLPIGLVLCGGAATLSLFGLVSLAMLDSYQGKDEAISKQKEIDQIELAKEKEKTRLKAEGEIAKERAQQGVISYDSIKITGYDFNELSPPRPQGGWSRDPVRKVVADQNDICIGYVENGTLFAKVAYDQTRFPEVRFDPKACENLAPTTEKSPSLPIEFPGQKL